MKKQGYAWLLVAALTFSSNTSVFAADVEVFSDTNVEFQQEEIFEDGEGVSEELISDESGTSFEVSGETNNVVSSGVCGSNVTWNLDDTGMLVISGTGEMSNNAALWNSGITDSIKNVVIENGVTSIGNGMFSGCENMVSITIPDSVTYIHKEAFMDCSSLVSVIIPDGVTRIDTRVFWNCSSLASIIMSDSVVELAGSTFVGCKNLTNLTLSNSLKKIDDNTFCGCESLLNFTVPDGVESIGNIAFGGCTNLKNIIIPNGVTTIGEDVFYECDQLTIMGYSGSAAEAYAKENHIPFKEITSDSSQITADVPIIKPDSDFQIGVTQDDYDTTVNKLKSIIGGISKGQELPGVELVNTGTDDVKEAIKNVIEEGGSIVTNVRVIPEDIDADEEEKIISYVPSDVENTKVEQTYDITIGINKIEENGESIKIGSITGLPEGLELTFTVKLTEGQQNKKIHIVYDHDNNIALIPENRVTQQGELLTFKADKFSRYYLISGEKEPAVANYTITFEAQGGSTVEPQTVTDGSTVNEPTDPIKSGYTFKGWYKDSAYTTAWNFTNDTVTSDTTLYAKWEAVPTPTPTPSAPVIPSEPSVTYYTVNFDSQGGSAVVSQSFTYGSRVTQPAAPTKEGYTFEGWYKDAACTTAWDFAKDTVTSSVTLHAKWKEVVKAPEKVSEVSSVATTTAVTITWKKVEGADGYVVKGRLQGETEFTWEKVIEDSDTLSIQDTDLTPGTVKEYIVLPYRTVEGEKLFGEASETITAVTNPAKAVIKAVTSKKGTAKVTLSKAAAGADGYEYAYSTKTGTWKSEKDYKLMGTTAGLSCTNKKMPTGIYIVRVRSYKTVGEEKVYGAWSSAKWFEVPSGTLAAPKILKVKVNKNTVTVTLSKIKGAVGYDCVLGTAHNPIKPTPYKYVKKNQNTVTITFENVKKGTYYIGAHAYNITKGKKYFSKWSNQEKVVIK